MEADQHQKGYQVQHVLVGDPSEPQRDGGTAQGAIRTKGLEVEERGGGSVREQFSRAQSIGSRKFGSINL